MPVWECKTPQCNMTTWQLLHMGQYMHYILSHISESMWTRIQYNLCLKLPSKEFKVQTHWSHKPSPVKAATEHSSLLWSTSSCHRLQTHFSLSDVLLLPSFWNVSPTCVLSCAPVTDVYQPSPCLHHLSVSSVLSRLFDEVHRRQPRFFVSR